MAEIVIRVEVPLELKSTFELALAKVVKQFIRRARFSVLEDVMSKSNLTDEQIKDLSDDLKERVAKRHRL
ncbi:hypothetical protein J4233_02055 [Candidatus Pacearchaeota archaeon]|nr:hypothetical protein [Candidatus Pacearchaeota archaeon]